MSDFKWKKEDGYINQKHVSINQLVLATEIIIDGLQRQNKKNETIKKFTTGTVKIG